MAEETKKISFGFSKLKKSNILVKPVEISKPQIDYVDSFDGAKGKFSYKGNVRIDEPVKKELIIPLIGTRTALDVIRSKLEENKIDQKKSEDSNEKLKTTDDGNVANGTVEQVSKEGVKKSEGKDVNAQLSIDDLAAKEIINDLHNKAAEKNDSNAIVIEQPNKMNNAGFEKDGPIDYENIPVNDFGLAMLRGMGWTPQSGIGKEQKVVQVVIPKLRPKGLGLGADKVVLQQANDNPDLTIAIKSFVKFSNGLHKGKYGQVESMDEDNGRVIVKLALGGTVSVSEVLLTPVTKKDYEKNSKVINPTTYESFKESDERSEGKVKSGKEKSSSDSKRKNHDDNRHRKEKYDRRESRDREKEDGNGNSDNGRRARRSTSSSSERKTDHKKKKKHTKGNSSDRKHKKSKKKRKKRRKYSSDEESDISPERKPERERSRNHRHHSKPKKNSHR